MPWHYPLHHLAALLLDVGWSSVVISDTPTRWMQEITAEFNYGADRPLVLRYALPRTALFAIDSDNDSWRLAMHIGDSFNEALIQHVRTIPSPQQEAQTRAHEGGIPEDRPSASSARVLRERLQRSIAPLFARASQGWQLSQQPSPEPTMAVQMAPPAEAWLDAER